MLKKPITFTNFDGVVVTENFYFNLTKTELTKMELGKSKLSQDGTQIGGMREYLQSVIDSGDGQTIIDAFEMFISTSYGVKSADGVRHTKSPELLNEFMSTAAYDVLFMEMVTDAEKGAEFIAAIMPADLAAEAKAAMRVDAQPAMTAPSILDQVKTFPNDNANQKAHDAERSPEWHAAQKRKPKRMTREEILEGMRAKTNPRRVLTYNDVLTMSQDQIDEALEAGATIEE